MWASHIFFFVPLFRLRMHRFRFFTAKPARKRKLQRKSKKRKKRKQIKKNIKKPFKLLRWGAREYLSAVKCCMSINHKSSFFICVQLHHNSLSSLLCRVVAIVWFCEKIHANVKFNSFDYDNLFENSVIISSKTYPSDDRPKLVWLQSGELFANYAKAKITSEQGYKIISKLVIKKELQRQADEWADDNLQGDWLGIHYRGTDVQSRKYRFVDVASYIDYLRKVVDEQYSIFACSDQLHFITQVHAAFPGRVFSRKIARSPDRTPLHKISEYMGGQQKEDALIDLLVLSKASLMYTTGSYFADVVRFLNPSIKIISLDGRKQCYKNIPNYIASPKI